MLILRNMTRVSPSSAWCEISLNAVEYEFTVTTEELGPGVRSIDYPELTGQLRLLLANTPEERSLIQVLCSYFDGETVTVPMEIKSDWTAW